MPRRGPLSALPPRGGRRRASRPCALATRKPGPLVPCRAGRPCPARGPRTPPSGPAGCRPGFTPGDALDHRLARSTRAGSGAARGPAPACRPPSAAARSSPASARTPAASAPAPRPPPPRHVPPPRRWPLPSPCPLTVAAPPLALPSPLPRRARLHPAPQLLIYGPKKPYKCLQAGGHGPPAVHASALRLRGPPAPVLRLYPWPRTPGQLPSAGRGEHGRRPSRRRRQGAVCVRRGGAVAHPGRGSPASRRAPAPHTCAIVIRGPEKL